ncbi:MAG: hypothetical protein JNL82_25230 [Myxococcales bacterium]|nr:hypothetical protein [Myxococcales bacterium]
MRRAWIAPVLGLWLVACGGPPRYEITVDRVVAGTFDEAGVRTALADAVAASGEFAAGEPHDALRLHASLVPGDDGPPRLHLELGVPDDLRGHFDVPAIRASAPVDGTLASAAAEAVQVLAWRFALARGRTDAAVGLLGAHDPETVLLALEWIRDRPAAADPGPELADAVARRLEQDDPEVVLLALDVLARVGQARHASAVIRRVERWPGLAREAYRTLGALGGADAVGFLQFAAANEDDAALQAEAARSLAAAQGGPSERVAARPSGVDLPRTVRGHRL